MGPSCHSSEGACQSAGLGLCCTPVVAWPCCAAADQAVLCQPFWMCVLAGNASTRRQSCFVCYQVQQLVPVLLPLHGMPAHCLSPGACIAHHTHTHVCVCVCVSHPTVGVEGCVVWPGPLCVATQLVSCSPTRSNCPFTWQCVGLAAAWVMCLSQVHGFGAGLQVACVCPWQ